jgi:hypothetical protein
MGSSALNNKIYCFDKVLSPATDQAMVFDAVVTPILGQVKLLSRPCGENTHFF